jgi:tellurite resistance-related uncharacterized protein
MLQILELTIKLGFYQTEAELRDICMVVIQVLDGSLDFMTPDEETQMLEYEQLVIAAKANPIVNKMPDKITRDPTTRY